ncbi:glycosyl transferase family 90 [Butyrivibrio sp. NC3005]|uniref:glycosyl transferase family 90 n=1 Tax=Butyrivibrio sp. NC3005 TaxID=1280685 RepID=UPI00041116C0|nr:glycosyl transferase family 90 [Butyrivibrio sp. NC3005]
MNNIRARIKEIIRSGGVEKVTFEYIIDVAKRLIEGQKDIVFKYNKKNNKLKIKLYGNVNDRECKTAEMLLAAFEKVHYELNGNIYMRISCHDICRVRNRKFYTYSRKKNNKNFELIPDYNFINWKESGIEDYNILINDILNSSKIDPIIDKLFWIGNPNNNYKRQKLLEMANDDCRMDIRSSLTSEHVSMNELTKFKYLLDIEGISWSSRRKILLFTGRPLFIVEDEWEEFFTDKLVPFVHYIPVKADLSDLTERLDWAENNYKKACEIGHNAQEFAINYLTREKAVDYLASQLKKIVNS